MELAAIPEIDAGLLFEDVDESAQVKSSLKAGVCGQSAASQTFELRYYKSQQRLSRMVPDGWTRKARASSSDGHTARILYPTNSWAMR
jgi:hypothetical protein